MRISHRYKFIFVHIPKTAGTTISLSLDSFSDIHSTSSDPYRHHLTIKEISKRFNYTNNYFTFAFVRNPWSRTVSWWHYINRVANQDRSLNPKFTKKCQDILKNSKNFTDFIKREEFLPSCFDWLSIDNKISVNYVGKMESLSKDFDLICNHIKIPHQTIQHRNASDHKHYRYYYNNETMKIVAKKYDKDIQYFDYEFEG